MTPYVEVRGDGVAAYACVHLLKQAGLRVSLRRSDRSRIPALLISQAALHLLRDIFDRPNLLEGRPPVRKRVVCWERGKPPLEVPHQGFIVSEQELLQGLAEDVSEPLADEPAWVVYCSAPLPASGKDQRLGSRMATAWKVELRDDSPVDACRMEALPNGWLFLLPNGKGQGSLLAVGDLGGDPLASSRSVVNEIRWLEECSPAFPAHPRIASTLSGSNWLACGSAVMAFDPICGDGTALAVRAAILAAAVIRAAIGGIETGPLLQHYESRVRAGFARHLELCRAYYSTGFGGPWWSRELAMLDTFNVNPLTQSFQFQLRNLELESVSIPEQKY